MAFTVTARRSAANSPAVAVLLRTVSEVPQPNRNTTPAPGRVSRAVTLVIAISVMASVLFVALQRIAGGFTTTEPATTVPAVTAPSTTAPATTPAQGGLPVPASATGSLAPAGGTGSSAPGQSASAPTTSVPTGSGQGSVFANPDAWPEILPDLGEHRLLEHSTGAEERWLLAVPGGPQLSGGRFLAGLERLGWKIDAVSTVNTVTAVGSVGSSRVSVTLRPGDDRVPQGWGLLEVVYLDRVPDFEPPTTTPPPTDEEAARKRS